MKEQSHSPDLSTSVQSDCCAKSSCCAPSTPTTRNAPKIGRNDPCPCGNGRKFKKCCGSNV